ncbi:EscE/YscE/SsaE family type III secretion system needle protein co-chaperone [Thiolinea disciformis]|uniref:EscE/YscE/SsaE family type III secretion system needle protein co-chaperone n=1 Tax=Thiolinea disciformis TaxID=125614 RepID=UPI0003673089|nr:EscE/YscE/SsaE family type III secretion system needle protein co-chaperone [Thiolinea disciformis]
MILQIEENLRNDVSGIYKNELLEKFSQVASQVRAELNQGVDPVQYEKLNKFLYALEAGSEVVELVWANK